MTFKITAVSKLIPRISFLENRHGGTENYDWEASINSTEILR